MAFLALKGSYMRTELRNADRKMLRPPEVEAVYGIGINHLQKLRMSGDGPPYCKPTHRMILYRRSDVEAWLEKHRVNSTSETDA